MKALPFLLIGMGAFAFDASAFVRADEAQPEPAPAANLSGAPTSSAVPPEGAVGTQASNEPVPAVSPDAEAVQTAKSMEALRTLLSAMKNDTPSGGMKGDPATQSASQELAEARQMAASILEQLKSIPDPGTNGAVPSSESEKQELAALTRAMRMLQSALASLKTLTPEMKQGVAGASNESAPAATDESTGPSAEEIAQAQAMAEAALKTPLSPNSTSPLVPAAAGKAVGSHHVTEEITNPDLGPDSSDPKHHSMDSML